MKNLIGSLTIISILILGSLTFSNNAMATDRFLLICEYIKVDNKNGLRKLLKNKKMKIRNLPKGFACNKKTIFEWALYNKSFEVADLIISKQSKKTLKTLKYKEKAEKSGNADIIAKIKKRVG